MRVALLALVSGLAGLVGAVTFGCGAFFDLDGLESGTDPATAAPDGSSGDGDGSSNPSTDGSGTEDGGPTPGSGCRARPGPKSVRIDEFCIDSTEVSRTHYLAFLDATDGGATAPRRDDVCRWNTTYVPDTPDWPPHGAQGDLPVIEINWCAAASYCAWAGKYLCRGKGTTPLEVQQEGAPFSQWYRACSRDGARTYAIEGLDASPCHTYDDDLERTPLPVGSTKGCEGGYEGLFDMTGNVGEWIDACENGNAESASCNAMGGSFASSAHFYHCDDGNRVPRYIKSDSIGVRCCADP